MAEPKKKRTRRRRDNARSQKFLKSQAISKCRDCQTVKLPHQVCPNCGKYKGEEVISVK
ncbi:MAG: large subunit ribosomal protein L32 [Candidatus Berkelbacteria bacterium Licking1014_85]|uniref:Large ribosomal subunit protein bL32 n=1 Tax=Candidatus Berkelbacteria bacterium Licking1014_85 TaxID=2017148 RepID=A0A554LML5_9BACT|nr:MAG: large subunit ribosomal protein L32 [Candidatus Berkelbacteria bacterium Licking1014_85]